MQDFHQPCVSVIFLDLCDFGLHLIADHCVLDKKSITVHFAYALSVYAYIGNIGCYGLIFPQLFPAFLHLPVIFLNLISVFPCISLLLCVFRHNYILS